MACGATALLSKLLRWEYSLHHDSRRRKREPADRYEESEMKTYLAEVLGTFLLVFIGTASVATGGFLADLPLGQEAIGLAFGIGLIAAAYAVGPISGAHLNPAVTLGVFLAGDMVAAPGLLSEVSWASGAEAGRLALAGAEVGDDLPPQLVDAERRRVVEEPRERSGSRLLLATTPPTISTKTPPAQSLSPVVRYALDAGMNVLERPTPLTRRRFAASYVPINQEFYMDQRD